MGLESESDLQLDALIASYLQRIERGESPNQAEWIAANPVHAGKLKEYFTDYNRIREKSLGSNVELPATVDNLGIPTGESPRIGNYKLLQQLGTGGMGEVWMADQERPVRRRVAVKLIKSGMDSKAVLARFEAERQALALMNHPNIAKVFDAGIIGPTDSAMGVGRPYFVMELVKGVPITEYCDAKRLDIRERLRLFKQCCGAVHHAHQKGIIHRDLKPSNILVENYDDEPVIKVIDFGLAKAVSGTQLTEKTLFTALGTIAGTPIYMAPEQAVLNALDIDIRADVYSLGVLLYELLSGSTPLTNDSFKEKGIDELLKLIREYEPPSPSQRVSSSATLASIAAVRNTEPQRLGRCVRGELDWIVMKSLAKERERRYSSAMAFSEDVERYLIEEPVQAGPPSASYRIRKFTRRNRKVVGVIAFALIVFVLGFVMTGWGLWEVSNARYQASLARDEAIFARDSAVSAENFAVAEKLRADALAGQQMAEKNRAVLAEQRIEEKLRLIQIDNSVATIAAGDGQSLRSLQSIPERHRKTGWQLVSHAVDSSCASFLDHNASVIEVGFNSNATCFYSLSLDGRLVVRNTIAGNIVYSENVAASAHLGSDSAVGTVAILEIDAIKLVKISDLQVDVKTITLPLSLGKSRHHLALHQDGSLVFIVNKAQELQCWDLNDSRLAFSVPTSQTSEVTCIAVGARCVYIGDTLGDVTCYSIQGGGKLWSRRLTNDQIAALSVSSDDSSLVVRGRYGAVIETRPDSGISLPNITLTAVESNSILTHTRIGEVLLCSDTSIYIPLPMTSQFRTQYHGHIGKVTSVSTTDDAAYLISGSSTGQIKLWNRSSEATFQSLGSMPSWNINQVKLYKEKWLACYCGDKCFRVWDLSSPLEPKTYAQFTDVVDFIILESGQIVFADRDGSISKISLEGNREEVFVAPDCQRILALSNSQLVMAMRSGNLECLNLQTLVLDWVSPGHAGSICAMDYSMDSDCFVTAGSNDRCIKVWDRKSGALLASLQRRYPVRNVSLSADGSNIISANDEEVFWVWQWRNGRLRYFLEDPGVPARAYFLEDQLSVTYSHNEVTLWNTEALKKLVTIKLPTYNAGSWLMDANQYALAIADREHIYILKRPMKPKARFLDGHVEGPVMAYSAGDDHIITQDHAGIWRIWDLNSGNAIQALSAEYINYLGDSRFGILNNDNELSLLEMQRDGQFTERALPLHGALLITYDASTSTATYYDENSLELKKVNVSTTAAPKEINLQRPHFARFFALDDARKRAAVIMNRFDKETQVVSSVLEEFDLQTLRRLYRAEIAAGTIAVCPWYYDEKLFCLQGSTGKETNDPNAYVAIFDREDSQTRSLRPIGSTFTGDFSDFQRILGIDDLSVNICGNHSLLVISPADGDQMNPGLADRLSILRQIALDHKKQRLSKLGLARCLQSLLSIERGVASREYEVIYKAALKDIAGSAYPPLANEDEFPGYLQSIGLESR